jgi:tripartite-type tricarboxylate transporter receptor subunit TctC
MFKRTLMVSCALLAGASPLAAQTYPAKQIRLIMPYPAGGSTDVVGRLVASQLSVSLGQQVVVDNRAGASGQIGTELAAKSPPDGYTLLMATSTNVINQAMNPKLPYEFLRDFQPVALVAKAAQLMAVHPSLSAKTVKEFVAVGRAHPSQITYASSGSGTSGHLAMEALAQAANIKLLHIPYKGNAPALNDVLGGQVASMFGNVVSALPHTKTGRLRALGVSTARRSALALDIPTIAESGYPGFEVAAWFGFVVPAGTPPAIVNRLSTDIVKALNDKTVQEKLLGFGVDRATIETPKEYGDFMQADLKQWARLLKEANIKAE